MSNTDKKAAAKVTANPVKQPATMAQSNRANPRNLQGLDWENMTMDEVADHLEEISKNSQQYKKLIGEI